jgi:hypothetical protein
MSAVDSLLAQIQHEANQRTDEVLIRLLARYDEDADDGACPKHRELRERYTMAAINHHRLRRRWRTCPGGPSWSSVASAEELLYQARAAYRDSVFHCGCSDKYDNRKEYKGRKKINDGRSEQPNEQRQFSRVYALSSSITASGDF